MTDCPGALEVKVRTNCYELLCDIEGNSPHKRAHHAEGKKHPVGGCCQGQPFWNRLSCPQPAGKLVALIEPVRA